MPVLSRYTVDLIIFTEASVTSPLYRDVIDALPITELVVHNQKNFVVFDGIAVGEANSYQLIRNRVGNDTITIVDSYKRGVVDRVGIDILIFAESHVKDINWYHSSDTLIFTETNTRTVSKPVNDTITFTETNSYTHKRNMSVTDTLTFTEGYTAYELDPYNPWYTIPNITGTDPVILKSGVLEFSSRHYEFGNTEQLEFTRVSRETRGGDIITGPTTATIETLEFTFLQLSNALCNELQSFIRATLGKTVEFKDHEGVWWNGVIMNPETPTVQTGRHRFNVSIQFEGVRQ